MQTVIEQLKSHGSVARGWLGVEIQPVTPDLAESLGVKPDTGALVAKESDASPAAKAGVKVGDVIEAVNGEVVASPRELARRIAAFGPEKSVSLTLARDGKEQKVDVTLGAMPNEPAIAAVTPAPEENGTDETTLGKLGLELEPAKGGGVKVLTVEADSAAAQRGLQEGDVIVNAGGREVSKPADIVAAMAAARGAGRKSLLLQVKSDQSMRFVALPLKKAS